MDVVRLVEQTIRVEQLLNQEDGIIVAVSGGPDSVALLHILFLLSREWDWRLVVAHVNHGFRGSESDAEAKFVEQLANKLGLPFEGVTLDLPAYIWQSGMNAQAAAREKRYDFLHQVAKKHVCTRIATAHHADDQMETIIMRFLRGSGSSGLAGILSRRPFKNVELIRPILRITKHDLLAFCLNHGLDYCEDSSNEKREYTRNRVRLELIPMLESYNPNLIETLTRLADTTREEDAFLHAEATALFERITTWEQGGYRFSAAVLGTLHVALQRRIVKLILSYLSLDSDKIDFVVIETVRQACLQQRTPSLRLSLGGGLRLVREYDQVAILSAEESKRIDFQYECTLDGRVLDIPEADVRMEALCMDNRAGMMEFSDPNVAFFDADLVLIPLVVRNRRDGDRMQLPGLNGRKKVKDIFIDLKIPPSRRDRIPLVFDAEGRLLWIPGIRQSSHAAVDESTTSVLRLSVIPLQRLSSY